MTTLSDINALIQQYVTDNANALTSANATLQGQITALQSQLSAANTNKTALINAIASLQAQLDAYKATPPAGAVETITVPDNFPTNAACLNVSKGFIGKGSALTKYVGRDNSSTRASEIAAIVAPKTNPYHILRMGGNSTSALVDDAVAQDFTLVGPTLGHTFGGIFLGPGNRGIVKNVSIYSCQGKLNGPPEETGLLVVWEQRKGVFTNVLLDGRRSGTAIASSPLMLSSCENMTINSLTSSYAQYGFAAACWRLRGLTRFTDCRFVGNRKVINIEQSEPNSSYIFERCSFGTAFGADYIMQASTRNMGRCTITFIDPVDTGPIRVKVFTSAANASAGGNGLLDSDIKVIVNGADVTSSRLQLVH